jgi:cob(I)alamin adenosyltransferase
VALGQGCIQLYTGKGKGKTSAALGLALRALGHGLKVYMVQFLKSAPSGELLTAEKLAPEFVIFRFAKAERDFFPRLSEQEKQDAAREVRAAFSFVQRTVADGACDILILDEILAALQLRLLELPEVLELLDRKPPQMELVLTGRHAPDGLIARADLVTRMEEVKHYYRAGIKSRPGIEK